MASSVWWELEAGAAEGPQASFPKWQLCPLTGWGSSGSPKARNSGRNWNWALMCEPEPVSHPCHHLPCPYRDVGRGPLTFCISPLLKGSGKGPR